MARHFWPSIADNLENFEVKTECSWSLSYLSLCEFNTRPSWIGYFKRVFAKVCFAQCSTSRLALGSPGCCCCCHHAQNIFKNLKVYIFEKPKVRGHQNWYSQLSNTQIHKYKCTNTALLKCQEYQTYAIFLNSFPTLPPLPSMPPNLTSLSNYSLRLDIVCFKRTDNHQECLQKWPVSTAGRGEHFRTGITTTLVLGRACTVPPSSTGTWAMDRTPRTTPPSQSHSHRAFSLAMTLPRFSSATSSTCHAPSGRTE